MCLVMPLCLFLWCIHGEASSVLTVAPTRFTDLTCSSPGQTVPTWRAMHIARCGQPACKAPVTVSVTLIGGEVCSESGLADELLYHVPCEMQCLRTTTGTYPGTAFCNSLKPQWSSKYSKHFAVLLVAAPQRDTAVTKRRSRVCAICRMQAHALQPPGTATLLLI